MRSCCDPGKREIFHFYRSCGYLTTEQNSRRDGLFSRPSQSDQAQVCLEMGQPFDFDSEIEGLGGQVGKLKYVSLL